MTDQSKSRASTHADNCWSWGPAHYECAVRKIKELRADLLEADEINDNLRHLLTRTAAALKGEPPEGVWHSWHDLPEKATQLADALRKLEEEDDMLDDMLDDTLERVPRDAADYIDLIYLWPDGTWCREEDLEEYLGFMSDDFEVHQVLAYDEHDSPCQTERLPR